MIDIAVRQYQDRPAARVEAMFDHVFAHPPAGLVAQRDAAPPVVTGTAH
jgi:hypothetical protein